MDYYMVFIHWPADGRLGGFHFLALMNNDAVNIHVQSFVQMLFLKKISSKYLGMK